MTSGRRRGLTILALAAVAGIVAGTAGVYVRGSGAGNVDPAVAALCADAVAGRRACRTAATGEVAAFRVAAGPESFRDLTFKTPEGAADDAGGAFRQGRAGQPVGDVVRALPGRDAGA